MKKILSVTMIVIVLLNLICLPSYADNEPMSTKPQETGTVLIKNSEGKTTNAGITGTTYSGAQGFKTLALVLSSPARLANACFTLFVETNSNSSASGVFTIYDLVMGNYDIFEIDFTEELPDNESDAETFLQKVKFKIFKFYAITRNLSIAVSLFVLIYVGIRMAISTAVSDQVKYKKMLINWVASLMLLAFMHLIIITISVILNVGIGIVKRIAEVWQLTSFEGVIYENAVTNLSSHGFNTFTSVVLIWMLTLYQAKFFFYYMKRTLEVHFLVIIAPLVTITYPIDKIGDGKAQAFGNLIKEVVIKCSMQIIHAIVYVAFIGTAGVIAVSQPLLAIFFFMALSRAEKITRNILGVNDKGFEEAGKGIPFVG